MNVAELLSSLTKEDAQEKRSARADFLALVDRLAQDKPHRDDGARARAILLAAGLSAQDLQAAVEQRRANRALALLAGEIEARRAAHKAAVVEAADFASRKEAALQALDREGREIDGRRCATETRLREAGAAWHSLVSLAPEAVRLELDQATQDLDRAERTKVQAAKLKPVGDLAERVRETEKALQKIEPDSAWGRTQAEELRERREALALAMRRDSGELDRAIGKAQARLAAVRAEILGQ